MLRRVVAAVFLVLFVMVGSAVVAGEDLALQFATPPDAAKPWAYWWWLDSFATREGITKDLEEMRRQGIAGVLLFDAGEGLGSPVGPVFMSPAWRELYKHAIREAHRLGIEVGVNVCSGWDAGGTWVKPEHASKQLVYSTIQVNGPGRVAQTLPMPMVRDHYYRDVAVVAFREADAGGMPAKLTASSSYPGYPPANATDGDPNTRWISNGDKPGQGPTAAKPEFLAWEFPQAFRAASLYLVPYSDCGPRQCELQSSGDGKTFQSICRFGVEAKQPKTVAFRETPARFFRLLITAAQPYGGSDKSWNVQIGEVALLQRGEETRKLIGIKNWGLKSGNQFLSGPPDQLHDEYPDSANEKNCESREVLDLSKNMDASGRLDWTAPAGPWTVIRFGYTLLGAKTKCVSPGAQGYEVDFMSAEAEDLHFAETGEKMVADAGPLVGKTLKYFHDDSYEVAGDGGQQPTWTPRFRAEFQARRGYDPLPYLPVLARRVVDSREVSNRFLWDIRRTIGDLVAQNHYRRFRELAQRHGLGTHPESGGPFWLHIDALECEGINDIPMGEFWKRSTEPDGPAAFQGEYATCDTVKQAASAAHIYGKRLCQAEAFTSMGPNWEEDPFMLKDIGDRAFCAGLTRNVLCFYVHQGRLDVKPGYQWEAAGTHFDRNITWWDQSHAWLKYLARCQYLLQQGRFVADVCYFYGEDVPNFVPAKSHNRPPLPKGYDCDTINADVLLNRLSVRPVSVGHAASVPGTTKSSPTSTDRRLVLPDGMTYRILVLPERRTMSPRILRKIKELAEAGATIVGPKPERAPGLTDYPQCDAEVRRLANAMWGNLDGKTIHERNVGKGRVVYGKGLAEILTAGGTPPDFEYRSAAKDANLDYLHRRGKGDRSNLCEAPGGPSRQIGPVPFSGCGETEIYFLSNQQNRLETAECVFRVTGRQPEIWDAVTGATRDAAAFRFEGGRTIVPLKFAPRQSWFVVFRRAASTAGPAGPRNSPELKAVQELAGPWTVRFDPKWGGPSSVVFQKLDDWTLRPELGIKYYSGKATYEKTFDLPSPSGRGQGEGDRMQCILLDLGAVKNVAQVRLNGKDLGVVWTAPWRVDITDSVRPAGNRLEIDVVNLWPNRLIGDAGLPSEKRYTVTNVKKFKKDSPLMPSGLLGPVTIQAAQ